MSSPLETAVKDLLGVFASAGADAVGALLRGESKQDAYDAAIERLASEKAKLKIKNLRDDHG